MFGVRLPSLRAPKQVAPSPWPQPTRPSPSRPIDPGATERLDAPPQPPEPEAAPVAETFLVIAHYRGEEGALSVKCVIECKVHDVGKTVDREIAKGATHVAAEPAWQFRPDGAT